MDNSILPMRICYAWKTVLLFDIFRAKEFSNIENIQAILHDHVKFGPVNGIEVFKYAGTSVIKLQVSSRQPGNSQ